jgi:hypothetical protein
MPQGFLMDEEQYAQYARELIRDGLWAHSTRLYGYPILIIPIFLITGWTYIWPPPGFWPFLIPQAVLDVLTGFLVYTISKKIFTSKNTPLLVLGLYMINPYTSAYSGVILTEIVTIFLITAVYALISSYLQKRHFWILGLTAFILGYIPQVRPSFFYFSVFMIFVIFWQLRDRATKLIRYLSLVVVTFILFALPFSYTVWSNLYFFHQFSLQSVDLIFAREVYLSTFIGRGIPFSGHKEWDWPDEAYHVWFEYSTQSTPEGRTAIAKRYMAKSWQIFLANPRQQIILHLQKMGYVWEKHYLFPYRLGGDAPYYTLPVYWGNFALLFSSFSGLIIFLADKIRKKDKKMWFYGLLTLFLFLYICIAHTFSTSEERFSLPAYPMVIVFAGYFFSQIGLWMKKLKYN